MIKSQVEAASEGISPMIFPTSALLRGTEVWLNAQSEVLSAMEGLMADWLRRRHEAFDSWSRSFKKMCECRDAVDFVQIQQDWLYDAIRLTTSDVRALVGDTVMLASKITAEVEKPVESPNADIPKTGRGKQEAAGGPSVERVAAE